MVNKVISLKSFDFSIISFHANSKDQQNLNLVVLDNDWNLSEWSMNHLYQIDFLKTKKIFANRNAHPLGLIYFNGQYYFWADGTIFDTSGEILVVDCSSSVKPIVFRKNIYYASKRNGSLLKVYFSNDEIGMVKLSGKIVDLCYSFFGDLFVLDDSGTVYSIRIGTEINWEIALKIAGAFSIAVYGADIIIGTTSGQVIHYSISQGLISSVKYEFAIRKVFIDYEDVFVALSDRVHVYGLYSHWLHKVLKNTRATCFFSIPLFHEKVGFSRGGVGPKPIPSVAIGCENGTIKIFPELK